MTKTLPVDTERFGQLQVPENEILFFPEGLLGFADRKRFVLIQDPTYEPFLWLQSTEDAHLCFVVVDPMLFLPEYRVEVKPSEIASLNLESADQARVLVIVVVRDKPEDISANLQGPLVIHPTQNLGKQIVLLTDKYHTRHYIMREIDDPEADQGNSTEGES